MVKPIDLHNLPFTLDVTNFLVQADKTDNSGLSDTPDGFLTQAEIENFWGSIDLFQVELSRFNLFADLNSGELIDPANILEPEIKVSPLIEKSGEQSILATLERDVSSDLSLKAGLHQYAYSAMLGIIEASTENKIPFHIAVGVFQNQARQIIEDSFPKNNDTLASVPMDSADEISDMWTALSRFEIFELMANADYAWFRGNKENYEHALFLLAAKLREFGYYQTAEVVYEKLISTGSPESQTQAKIDREDMLGNNVYDLSDSTKDILTREGLIGVLTMAGPAGISGFALSAAGRGSLLFAAKKITLDHTAKLTMHKLLTSKTTHALTGAYLMGAGINGAMVGINEYRFGDSGYENYGDFGRDTFRLGTELLIAGTTAKASREVLTALKSGKIITETSVFGIETLFFTGVSGAFSHTETFRRKGEEPVYYFDDSLISNAIFLGELRLAKRALNVATGERFNAFERNIEISLERKRLIQILVSRDINPTLNDKPIGFNFSSKEVEELYRLMERMTSEEIIECFRIIPKEEYQPFIDRIFELLKHPNSKQREQAVTALGKIYPLIPQENLLPLVEKIMELLDDSDWSVRFHTINTLGKILPALPKENLLPFVEKITNNFVVDPNPNSNSQAAKVEFLGKIVPLLPLGTDLMPFVKEIAVDLNHNIDHVRCAALDALKQTLPLIPKENLMPFVEKIATLRIFDGGRYVLEAAQEALDVILPLVPQGELRLFTEKVVPSLKSYSPHERTAVHNTLSKIFPLLAKEDLFLVAKKIAQLLKFSFSNDIQQDQKSVFKEAVKGLSVGDLLRFISHIQESFPLNNPEWFSDIFNVAEIAFENIPIKARHDFAASPSFNKPENNLFAYLYYEGPDIFQIYSTYLKSIRLGQKVGIGYLKNLKQEAKDYRYGKDVNPSNTKELQNAYIALDRPNSLQSNFGNTSFSWEFFVSRMREAAKQVIPSRFLNNGFSFRMPRSVMVHETIDKGIINNTITSTQRGRKLSETRHWFIKQFFSSSFPAPVRKILRACLIKKFKFDENVDFTKPEIRQKIESHLAKDQNLLDLFKEIYPLLISHTGKGNPKIEEILENILLAIVWRHPGAQKTSKIIDDYQTAVKNNKLSSQQLLETLDNLLLFYSDLVGETLHAISPDKQLNPPKGIIQTRDTLQNQKGNVKMALEGSYYVELIPSKARSDQFFGYIGEDCTKNRGSRIFNPNFMVYRMIVDGQLRGMVYVEQRDYKNKKALILAIGPQERLSLDHKVLLKNLEIGFGQIAQNEGYDYVLISSQQNEQGNRVDMLKAIQDSKYQSIRFKTKQSDDFFQAQKYYIMVNTAGELPSTKNIYFLQETAPGKWEIVTEPFKKKTPNTSFWNRLSISYPF